MADYTWELGIDWDAIDTAGTRYLRHGFVKNEEGGGGTMTQLRVKLTETIQFKIFDVTSTPPSTPNNIKSFTIIVKVAEQPPAGEEIGDPFDRFQLTFLPPPALPQSQPQGVSIAFGGSFPVWLPEAGAEVTAKAPGRFLLSFLVQAGPENGGSLVFIVDPEMIVGASTVPGLL